MKALVVYYSLQGNTKFIADTIAKAIETDILELKPIKTIPKKGFLRYLIGGKQAWKKEKPELVPFDKDPNDYDLIFIGTPVWAWTYSAPCHTFFSTTNIKNKKIAFFCCHAGDKGKTFIDMENALAENEFLENIDFEEPLKMNKEANEKRVAEWVQKQLTNLTQTS